jgi:CheY-like chemotaxis protein
MNKMLSSILGEHIDLRLETSRQPEWIEADPGQIEQVVLNLLVNARDAMQRGGTILITSSKTEIDEHEASELAIAAGNYVRMTVTDNGTGMDEATRRQVFEPFFSTKTGEGGTGLGLSTVYGIVRQCGGHIRVESEPGRGSTFTIYFPQSEAPTASLRPAAEPTTVQTGSETILVAEDSEDLRQLVLRILQDNGYKVLQAGDGEEAIRVAKEYPGEIDLVISDIVMPRLSGPEAVEAIRQQRPQIKILLISGDALNVETSKLSPEWTVLEKPLSPEALLVKVREALDQGFEKSKLIAMFIFTSAGLSQAEPFFSDFWAA